jgi:nucleotide-binding universal stress UspA family protein
MLPISRILMPVDFSERCLGMIPHVSQFARQYDAEILLLHVVNPVYVIPETGISASAILSAPEWILTTQRKKMEEFAASELRDFRVRRLVLLCYKQNNFV